MRETEFFEVVRRVARGVLPARFEVQHGHALIYRVTADSSVAASAASERPVPDKAMYKMYKTDVCVIETTHAGVDAKIPRVVIEFKQGVGTHDVLTYSTKARKHKLFYPYLRYGLAASRVAGIPDRFFLNNESLDFFVGLASFHGRDLDGVLGHFLKKEVAASEKLERIAAGQVDAYLYRTEVELTARRAR